MASEIKVDTIVNAGGDNDTGIDLSTNDIVKVNIAGAEKARVHSDGKVGIGTNSPSYSVHVKGAASQHVAVESTNNTVIGAFTASTDDLFIGAVSNDNFVFETNGTERMRIDSSGTVGINNSSPSGCKLEVSYANADVGMVVSTTDTFSSGNSSLIQFKEVDTVGGSIVFTNGGSSTAYVTSSDHRLKENVSYEFDATTRLKQLKPCRFNFKKTPNITVDGFLAHEVTAVPEAVVGEKDAVDLDGNIQPQAIDQAKLVPLLTKALQEAVAKIETLEAKVTALESK